MQLNDLSLTSTSRILIVDDIPDNLGLLVESLSFENFDIVQAGSFESACGILKNSEAFDLVLADVNLGDGTGFDLVRWMLDQKSSMSEVPVLLITSEVLDDHSRTEGLLVGAVDYVLRPVSGAELAARINKSIHNCLRFQMLRKMLEVSQRQANAGQILAASNHEVANLAHLILLNSEALMSRLGGTGSFTVESVEALDILQTVHFAARTLGQLSSNLASFFSLDEFKFRDFEILPTLRSATALLRPMLTGSSIVLKIRESDFVGVVVNADPSRVTQIILNFLLNAIDAIKDSTKSGGSIDILRTGSQTGFCEVRVKDSGIGLATSVEQFEFRPFESTRISRGGRGLGLWLSSLNAKLMGGSVSLVSDGPNCGASAVLTLKTVVGRA